MRRIAGAVGLLIWSAALPAQPATALPGAPAILHDMTRVADWELAHLEDAASNPPSADARKPLGWIRGTFYTGLTALADRSDDPRYADTIFALGEHEGWRLGPNVFNADDYQVAQTWIWAYGRQHNPRMIAATRQRFDRIIKEHPSGSLLLSYDAPGEGCFRRWCWADGLFMGPPGWVGLSLMTGDPRYLAYADKEYRATTALLFDPDQSLFYRDSRFKSVTDDKGRKIFWSRGNGWVYAGLARILTLLPPHSPSRAFYRDLFLRLSPKLMRLQKPDGCWPQSLLDFKSDTAPETSGTGLIVYGLAWGIGAGLLPKASYGMPAERGWACLTRAVAKDGKLKWVQSQNEHPDSVQEQDTQPFGAGAFLLAGSALYDLAHR
jgi:unsaturated rhamnogalacturonyl hydrolase